MYYILVNDDDTLYGSKKERIMQRSKLMDKLCFVVSPLYRGVHDMTNATVVLEYVLPISREYHSVNLTLSDERYENCYLQYELPFDTNITSEAGSVEMQLTFAYVELDVNGNSIQRVRKTSSTTVDIIPITAWSDIIPDSALTALDQRIIKLDAQMRAIDEMNQYIADTKADNIKYDSEANELQLLSNGNEIGEKVKLDCKNRVDENGVPVVDFGDIQIDEPEEPEEDNVVEF